MDSWIDVSVLVEITSLLGQKLSEDMGPEPLRFDLSAKLEEKERRTGKVVISFGVGVRTKPSVVKYDVEGNATITGKDALIAKMLETDPKSKIPFVLHRVYQKVFTVIYTLASFMGTAYPPPNLLFSSGQNVTPKSSDQVPPSEATVALKETESIKPTESAAPTAH